MIKTIENMIEGWIVGFVNYLATLLTDLVATPQLYQEDWAVAIRGLIVTVAWSLLALKVMVEAWKLYIAREAGEQTYGIGVLLRRTAYAGAAIHLSGWAVHWFWEFSSRLTKAVAQVALPNLFDVGTHGGETFLGFVQGVLAVPLKQMVGAPGYALATSSAAALKAGAAGAAKATAVKGLGTGMLKAIGGLGPMAILVAFVIVIVVLMMIIWVQSYLRGAELTLIFLFGPLFALSAVSEDDPFREGSLGVMAREIVVLTIAQVVQMAGLIIVLWYTISHLASPTALLPAIAFMIVTIRVPTWLRNFVRASGHGADSGAGQMLTSVVRVGSMAVKGF